MKKKKDYTVSSGNVFADLKMDNPKECLIKAELASRINDLIDQRMLTQTAAAELLSIDQPKVSALNTGNLAGFSISRLLKFLNKLDQDVTIEVAPKKRSRKTADLTVRFPEINKKRAPLRRSNSPQTALRAKKKQ